MKQEPDYIFSNELRKKMQPFNDLNCEEALNSPEFIKAFSEHSGLSIDLLNSMLNLLRGLED